MFSKSSSRQQKNVIFPHMWNMWCFFEVKSIHFSFCQTEQAAYRCQFSFWEMLMGIFFKVFKNSIILSGNEPSRGVSVTATLKVHPLLLPLSIYVFFPTCRYISVNLAVELISQSGLRHVNLTEGGEWTWHPFRRICSISALTKQSIRTHITFHLPPAVSSGCVESLCLFSSVLLTRWLLGVQRAGDSLTGYHHTRYLNSCDLMTNVVHKPKILIID